MRVLVQGKEEDEREVDCWERGRDLYTEAKGTPGAALRVGGHGSLSEQPQITPKILAFNE